MRISDWSSDVCSSDISEAAEFGLLDKGRGEGVAVDVVAFQRGDHRRAATDGHELHVGIRIEPDALGEHPGEDIDRRAGTADPDPQPLHGTDLRSEEHTSELQSLMRISYAVFCLKKKNKQ